MLSISRICLKPARPCSTLSGDFGGSQVRLSSSSYRTHTFIFIAGRTCRNSKCCKPPHATCETLPISSVASTPLVPFERFASCFSNARVPFERFVPFERYASSSQIPLSRPSDLLFSNPVLLFESFSSGLFPVSQIL